MNFKQTSYQPTMKFLFIIAPQGYQDIEYETPKKILKNAGHEVTTASTVHEATGSLGGQTKTDLLLQEAKVENFDVIVFIGGPGSSIYFTDKTAHKLAQDFFNAGKTTAAICAAPIILGKAGLLKGKKATCYAGGAQMLKETGAIYTANQVEKDGLLITADGPPSAKLFGETLAKL